MESRVSKSIKNARVNLIFYFAFLFLSFFSRKIFLEHLGTEFIGLTGTLDNFLGLLSLAELGIGAATAYNLYKPLQEHNQARINELVSVFAYLYRIIGLTILGFGLVLCAVFPLIFKGSQVTLPLVYTVFFSLLSSSLIGYFINYRQIVVEADQKEYIVTRYLKGAAVIKVLSQMLVAAFWGNLYAWAALDLIFAIIGCVILNIRINREYPWLKTSTRLGKQHLRENKKLVSDIKQIFVHRFADFILRQSDHLFIFAFVSLEMVAFYGNYMLIINKISDAMNTAIGGSKAGVGNLIAEGDKGRMSRVFWEMMAIRFIGAGIIIFGLYHLLEPFICIWLGPKYIMDRGILVLLTIISFFTLTRGTVDVFKDGFGLFADTWAPAAEAAITIVCSLALAPWIGIPGLLIGKLCSFVLIIFLWKPFYVFRNGFHDPVLHYWKEYLKYLIVLAFCFTIAHFIVVSIPLNPTSGILSWVFAATLNCLIFTVIYLIALYATTGGTRDLANRIHHKISNKNVA